MGKSQEESAGESSKKSQKSQGKLYIVATPIGNLEDITFRALRVLNEVDLIAAEDPTHTLKLLNHYGIKKALTRYHEPNEEIKATKLLRLLERGQKLALVSKAGLPGLSDPGYRLIKGCIEENISVEVIPGASAILPALVVSGLPSHKFTFLGFLPRKGKEQRETLENLKGREETLIFYESPQRLVKTLENILRVWGDRKIAVARELTKKFEEIKRGTVKEVLSHFKVKRPRGEFVIVVEGRGKEPVVIKNLEELRKEIFKEMKRGVSKKEAIKLVAQKYKIPKGKVYEASLGLKKSNEVTK